MNETWRPIPEWVGLYEASSLGRIRSLDRATGSRHIKGRILRPAPNPKGYMVVILTGNGRRVGRTVHALVAAAFFGPRPDGMQVCHGDNDPSNNAVTNLRYDTASANNRDKRLHGTDHNLNKTHCPQGHPYDDANTRIAKNGGRNCRACHRERTAERRAAARAEQLAHRAALIAA